MHPSAMENCRSFFETYSRSFDGQETVKVVEIGSQDVNGSLREVSPPRFEYLGLDFEAAKGVDLVLDDPYHLPLADGSADIVLSSSCFEHSEMFWLVVLEVMRILKPGGLFYMNAPSAGTYHRYPVDCWRFYPDSGLALATWARRSGYPATLLESYIQKGGNYQDFVAVFARDVSQVARFPNRIVATKQDFENGHVHGHDGILKPAWASQNERKFQVIGQILTEQLRVA